MQPEFILYVVAQLVSIGVIYGVMTTKVNYIEKSIERLEKKQDKHNGVIERLTIVEQKIEGIVDKISSHIQFDRNEYN